MGYQIDFLPVGDKGRSGDAIAMRFGNLYGDRSEQTIILIDGGFKNTAPTIINHLDTHYGTDRIDLVVSTHPDGDHINGLLVVVDELKVDELWMHRPSTQRRMIELALSALGEHEYRTAVASALDTAEELEDLALQKGITIQEPFTGLTHTSGSYFVLGPSEGFYQQLFREPTLEEEQRGLLRSVAGVLGEYVGRVAESLNIETLTDEGITTPLNNSSAVTMLKDNGDLLLFTSDAGITALSQVADVLESQGFVPPQLKFIQVPHHGSRRNVGPSVLDRLLGTRLVTEKELGVAYVSCAPDGEPKHPAKKVTNAFRRRGAPVHATKGTPNLHHRNAPDRGWSPSVPLPLFPEVDD